MLSLQQAIGRTLSGWVMMPGQVRKWGGQVREAMLGLKEVGLREQGRPLGEPLYFSAS